MEEKRPRHPANGDASNRTRKSPRKTSRLRETPNANQELEEEHTAVPPRSTRRLGETRTGIDKERPTPSSKRQKAQRSGQSPISIISSYPLTIPARGSYSTGGESKDRPKPVTTNLGVQNGLKRHRSIEAAEVYNQNDKRLKKSSPHSPLPANKSFEGHPAVSPESKSKSTLMSYSGARDGGHQGGRIRDTVGDSVTGGRLQRTESASEGLGKGPRLQSHSLQQEISAPNASKDNSKNNQREYRCPQCSFPCWLCNTSEVPGLESESSSEEESGQPETMDMNTLSRSTSKRKRTDGLTYLGPREERFRDFVLGPCGVRIKEGVLYLQPGEIPGDGIQDDPTVTSRVRLEINDTTANETSVQFLCYDQRKYDETTLTKLVTHYLAPFECYINADGPQTVVSLCKDKWRPRKEGPPVPPLHGATYDWDIEPDITYMVALNLFEKDLRDTMQWSELYWLLAEPLGVCPYLTFELKCAEKSGKNSDVNCQISAASVLWLYQRKKLKDVLKSSDLSDLRHYSIVINSMAFQIWVTVFDGRFYSVQMIDRGSFERPEGVKRYAEWSNAIHKWGLGPNARSFKRDVEVLWKSMSH